MKKSLNILLFSYDWRDMFRNDFDNLKLKLERDRVGIAFNNIFLISWSNKSYFAKKGNLQTVHLRTILHFRVFCDFLLIFLSPIILFVKKFKPEVVVIREFPLIFGAMAVKLFFNTKIVFFLGSMPLDLAKSRKFAFARVFYHHIAQLIGRYAIDVFIANGEATKEYFIKMGIPEKRVAIMIEDVIMRDEVFINKATRGCVRTEYDVPEDKKIVLSVGRLEDEKGFDRLLSAFAQLKRDDLVLMMVGDGILKNKLKLMAEKLQIDQKVIFTGYVERDKIWQFYRDADLFMLFSLSEGSPTVFREAMYAGVPCIGSKIPPIIEFLGQSGERGFVWGEDDSIDDLMVKMNICLDDDKNREMTKRSQIYIKESAMKDYNINDFI